MKTNKEIFGKINYELIWFFFILIPKNVLNWQVWLNMKSQIVLENILGNVSNANTHTWWLYVWIQVIHVFSIFNVHHKVLSFSTFSWMGSVSHKVISKYDDHAVAEWDRWMHEQWLSNRMNKRPSECMFTSSQCFSSEMRRLFGASWTTLSIYYRVYTKWIHTKTYRVALIFSLAWFILAMILLGAVHKADEMREWKKKWENGQKARKVVS